MLCCHELEQQQQGLHSYPKGGRVDHCEQGTGVPLYQGLHVFGGNKWEGTTHTSYDGTQNFGISFFSLCTKAYVYCEQE